MHDIPILSTVHAITTRVGVGFLLLFLFSANLLAQTKMAPAEATALEAKVKKLALTTETITSDFIQYKHLDFLSSDIKSTGKLSYKSPNLVKWEYLTPFEYALIFKEETLYINNEGKKSNMDMGSNKLFEQLNKLITNSIKGDMFDTEEFHISYYEKGHDSEVHFAPKNPKFSDFIKVFHLTFNEKGEVIVVKMVETSNDYTQIIFSNRMVNTPLSDAVFAH